MSNRFFKLKRIVLILTLLSNVNFWSRVYIDESYLSILRSCFVSLICCLFLFCLLCWCVLVKVAFFVVLFLFVIITSSLRALQVVVRYTSKPVKHNPIPPLLANPVNFGQFWNYLAIRVSRMCTYLHSDLKWHRIVQLGPFFCYWSRGGAVRPLSPDRKQMREFWPIFSLKLDFLILKTHFISLWGVSKMHFSCPLRLCYTTIQPIFNRAAASSKEEWWLL